MSLLTARENVELSTPYATEMLGLSIPGPHTVDAVCFYLLTFALQRHTAGQEPNPGSVNELLVCAQLGCCECDKQVLEGDDRGFIMILARRQRKCPEL